MIELGVGSSSEARSAAERELAQGPRCGCCVSARVHLSRFFGSTLFLDDDPTQLWLAIPLTERERWTPSIVAACIVLHGRARCDLYRQD
jgi:hypothetical protein